MTQEYGNSQGESQHRGSQGLSKKTWVDYLWVIREHWLVGLILAAVISGFYIHHSLRTVPIYKSNAILLFEFQQEQVINIQPVESGVDTRSANIILKNHLTDLRSNSFRRRVIDSLSPDEVDMIRRDYIDEETGEPANIHAVVAGANKINLIGGNIFNFEFHHRNPQAAALLANRFSEEFKDFLLERSRKSNEAALRFLRSQTEELKLKVERSELAVQQYRQERNLVSLEESQNLIVERMKNLSGNLNEARVELLNLTASLEQINAADGDLDKLEKIPSITQMGTIPAKFERRTNLISEQARLSLRYGKRHPRMIQNTSALETVESEIRMALEKNVSDFIQQHKEAQARVANLQEALGQAEKEALELDQIAIEYNVLRRKLETDKRLFSQVHQRLNEAVLASQLSDSNLRVVDRAWPAAEPFTPNNKKIYSTGVFLFFLAFAGVPFGVHYLNLNLKTASEIEQELGIAFLGEIRKFPRKWKGLQNLVLTRHKEPEAEAFRQIHSQILLKINHLKPGHTLVVTSALPKEGKSFFAVNLAASFSRHHRKTLLIDCDFRRPSISGYLSEYIGDKILDPQKPVPIAEMFDVQFASEATVEATEFIQSDQFTKALERFRQEYDVVIIDTPPAGLFPDAGMIGQKGDHFIFLTQINKHRKRNLHAILNRLRESHTPILGLVVNKVSKSKSRNLGAHRYGDYSKYKSYYNPKVQAQASRNA